MIEIGHIDINTEVSLLSPYSVMPRQGHLEAASHIMGYLKLRHNSTLAFDPLYPNIDHSKFWECDIQISLRLQQKSSHPMLCCKKGSEVYLQIKVGRDNAGNKWARRSRARFMIYS